MDVTNFPNMESFVIEITELSTEGDIWQKSEPKVITDLKFVGEYHPSCSHNATSQRANSIDLVGKLGRCYRSGKPEQVFKEEVVDYRKNPKSDDGRITVRIVCRVKYKEPSAKPAL
jgi:hypothetical protein